LLPVPIPDYQLALFDPGHVKLATAVAGVVGTVVVFAVGLGLARGFARPRAGRIAPDAALGAGALQRRGRPAPPPPCPGQAGRDPGVRRVRRRHADRLVASARGRGIIARIRRRPLGGAAALAPEALARVPLAGGVPGGHGRTIAPEARRGRRRGRWADDR